MQTLVLDLSRRHRLLAPLAFAVGALVMLFEGVKLLVTNWRLTLVQSSEDLLSRPAGRTIVRMWRSAANRHLWCWTSAAVAVAIVTLGTAARAAAPVIPVTVFAHTGIRLADVVWTGSGLLYVENTTNSLWRPGSPPTKFASMPRIVEETRCVAAFGGHGFSSGEIYCHSPDNVIYRIGPTGTVDVFARLPDSHVSDGAIAFDTVGAFGFRLLAATGRSGSPTRAAGSVYAVDSTGVVAKIGDYSSSTGGGADELVIAPRPFGQGAGQIVLTVDAGSRGALVMMDAHGHTRQIATLPDGPNPIEVVPSVASHGPLGVARGLYLTDTNSTNVFFVPAARLTRFAGDLIVGTEIKARFWVVAPSGHGFRTRKIPLAPPGKNFNLEGATYVG